MMFSYEKNKKGIRIGKIQTRHGDIKTPAFLPDATYGTVKTLSFRDVERCGIAQVLCTTLHLYIRPGDTYIKRMGKLHSYLNWNKPILTDSGGWQVFSLIHQSGRGNVSNEGARFYMPTDGSEHFLTPEKSIEIQANLGSDIHLVLDDPIIGNASYKDNKRAVDITIAWAEAAKEAFLKQYNLTAEKFNNPKKYKRPLLFSIIQGGNYKRLRKKCAEKLIEIGFDGYGYGGILLKDDQKKTREILKYFAELVPDKAIRYGMGVGRMKDIQFCVENGFDLFDSVVPTRNARHGHCYTTFGGINVRSSKYKYDKRAIDRKCDCEACHIVNRKPAVSRAYLWHLFKVQDSAAMRLCTMHNLHYYEKTLYGYRV